MTPNPKKSASPWCACEKCQVRLSQKDVSVHDLNCPPSTEKWNHSYIQNGILYSTLEVFQPQELPKNISDHAVNDMVFMAQSALQLCEIPIADPVVLFTKDNVVVKIAWPTSDKTLTSVSLTKSALELNKLEGLVKAKKLKSNLHLAKEFIIESVGKYHPSNNSTEVDILIKGSNERKIFCIGNRINISYYGRKLVFKIVDAKADKIDDECLEDKFLYQDLLPGLEKMNVSENDESNVKFYRALFSTKWTIIDSKLEEEKEEPSKPRNRMEDVGGYDELIMDLRVVVDIALGKYKVMKGFNITKGVLLYGTAGVGKSMIANALISEYDAEPFNVTGPEIYSKYVGETESRLREIFNDAKLKAPSIILMEDIDILCPRRTSSTTDQERRVIATLLKLLDELQNSNANVLVLATTSRIDSLDASLRRPGRIDKEFEVCVPTPSMRHEMFLKFLLRVPNTLTDDDIKKISFVTHGFVGADLYSLCSRAATHAIQYQKESIYGKDDLKVSMEDFNYALTIVKPSAMKEVRVEVPDVRWSDIGGQDDLKLKLKQAVEWPLQHPEAFVRLGITPPRGVLMFGPPGCSKTMIAKALATESKLNFLNIKGPELFSKWVGESERAVREVFRKARQVAPSIVFIDEIDALGSERTSANAGGSNVQERVLAQLLTELDGVVALGNVTLVAATNRPDKIDKALLRPGRLDRIVYVPLPDAKTRKEIFDIKLRKMPVSKDVVIQDLVELTEGYSGAEVQAICHEAAMKALEHDLNATTITKKHFKAALSIVIPRTPTSLIKLYEDYISKSM